MTYRQHPSNSLACFCEECTISTKVLVLCADYRGGTVMTHTRILWICGSVLPSIPEYDQEVWLIDRQSPTGALDRLRRIDYQAILIDGLSGILRPDFLVEQIQLLAGNCPVLVRGVDGASAASRLTRLGVVLLPEADIWDAIRSLLTSRAAESLGSLAKAVSSDGGACEEDWERLLVGTSSAIRQVRHVIRMVGSRRATVLISGETGTGKEVAARALHQASSRRKSPLIAVNCSALPDNLMEAELFGHVRGAFTGAVQNRVGRFEQAQGGTLFLDEIGELPLELQ